MEPQSSAPNSTFPQESSEIPCATLEIHNIQERKLEIHNSQEREDSPMRVSDGPGPQGKEKPSGVLSGIAFPHERKVLLNEPSDEASPEETENLTSVSTEDLNRSPTHQTEDNSPKDPLHYCASEIVSGSSCTAKSIPVTVQSDETSNAEARINEVDLKDIEQNTEISHIDLDSNREPEVGVCTEDRAAGTRRDASAIPNDAALKIPVSSEVLPLQPKEGEVQKVGTVKCAGCGKVFSQPCALPQRAGRLVLSLCDDCENITSAMFICISCGQECSSLAALRAHKQTHVVPEQRVFVCEVCGVGFHRQIDLEVHKCAGVESEITPETEAAQSCSEPMNLSRSRRKPRVTQKVRVEAIVNTLSKKKEATKTVQASSKVAPKKAPPAKRSPAQKPPTQPKKRGRKKTVRKVPSVAVQKKTPQPSKSKKLLINISPPPPRLPRTARKTLKIPKVYQCKECPEFSSQSKDLRKHKATHSTEIFTCETCKKEFSSKHKLKRHEYVHRDTRSTVCDICNKRFKTGDTMRIHRNTVHNDEKPFVCDICHKDFKQLGNMKTHRRTHTGERPFICKECGRSFAQMGNLQAHMVIHAAAKPHICETCGKGFSYLRSLHNHMRGTHTGERPFECKVCGKAFSNRSVLREHQRIHSDKRGYLCDKCGKGFKSYKNLKQHEKFHLEVRPYNCTVCGKSFVWFKSFQLHKRTHTGEKPYHCDLCEKVFSNINSLKNHKQKHLAGYTPPPHKSRSKANPSTASAPPPSHLPQTMIIPHPSLHPVPSRDHMINIHHPHHEEGPSHSPPSTPPHPPPPNHPTISSHSQAYGHVVFPQAFPFVTNPSGDFTIL